MDQTGRLRSKDQVRPAIQHRSGCLLDTFSENASLARVAPDCCPFVAQNSNMRYLAAPCDELSSNLKPLCAASSTSRSPPDFQTGSGPDISSGAIKKPTPL